MTLVSIGNEAKVGKLPNKWLSPTLIIVRLVNTEKISLGRVPDKLKLFNSIEKMWQFKGFVSHP